MQIDIVAEDDEVQVWLDTEVAKQDGLVIGSGARQCEGLVMRWLADLIAELEKLRNWPRCLACNSEMVEGQPHEAHYCPLCREKERAARLRELEAWKAGQKGVEEYFQEVERQKQAEADLAREKAEVERLLDRCDELEVALNGKGACLSSDYDLMCKRAVEAEADLAREKDKAISVMRELAECHAALLDEVIQAVEGLDRYGAGATEVIRWAKGGFLRRDDLLALLRQMKEKP